MFINFPQFGASSVTWTLCLQFFLRTGTPYIYNSCVGEMGMNWTGMNIKTRRPHPYSSRFFVLFFGRRGLSCCLPKAGDRVALQSRWIIHYPASRFIEMGKLKQMFAQERSINASLHICSHYHLYCQQNWNNSEKPMGGRAQSELVAVVCQCFCP